MNADVLILEPSGRSGVCHYTFKLCQALRQAQARVCLVTSQDYEMQEHSPGFPVQEIFRGYRTPLPQILRSVRDWRAAPPRVIHLQASQHPELYLPLLGFFKARIPARYVVTVHDTMPHATYGQQGLGVAGQRWAWAGVLKLADAAIVHTRAQFRELSLKFPWAASKLRVIPHGNYMFSQQSAVSLNLNDSEKQILFFGNILPYKGLKYLIRAFSHVRQSVPASRLIICGKPFEDMAPYQALIHDLGLREAVEMDLRYIPFEEIQKRFSQAHVIALPYLHASSSGVLQMAYALGKPVVASRVGGLEEAVEDGRSGFLVAPGDVAGLAFSLIRILRDEAQWQDMGQYARHLAQTQYAWESIAEKTMAAYGLADE